MSSKSSRGPVKVTKQAPPRALEEIQAEYGRTASQAGALQYQLFILEQELQSLNNRMLQLNREGAERNKLNEESKAKESADVKS